MPVILPRFAIPVFITLLALITFLFGGNFPLAQGLMPVFCAALVALTAFLPTPTFTQRKYGLVVAGVFVPVVFILIWGAFQIMPLPAGSSLASPFWNIAPAPAIWSTISVNPSATLT